MQNIVTLIDGRKVDAGSEEWRAECYRRWQQVREVCGMLGKQNRGKRDAFCTRVGAMEGEEAERRLRAQIRKEWRAGVDQ